MDSSFQLSTLEAGYTISPPEHYMAWGSSTEFGQDSSKIYSRKQDSLKKKDTKFKVHIVFNFPFNHYLFS